MGYGLATLEVTTNFIAAVGDGPPGGAATSEMAAEMATEAAAEVSAVALEPSSSGAHSQRA